MLWGSGRHDDAHMPTVVFTPQLRRFVDAPEVLCDAADLRAALDAAFARQPRLRAYVLDEQGGLRPNVMVFIDGQRCDERQRLDQALAPGSRIHVMQALSGG